MSNKTYRAIVTREEGAWLADIADLEGGHTYARNLPGLDESVREVIAMIEDLPEGSESSLKIEYEYHTGNQQVDRMTAWLRTQRERIRREERELAEKTAEIARELVQDHSMSVRDAAALIGVAPQRISQLVPSRRKPTKLAKRWPKSTPDQKAS